MDENYTNPHHSDASPGAAIARSPPLRPCGARFKFRRGSSWLLANNCWTKLIEAPLPSGRRNVMEPDSSFASRDLNELAKALAAAQGEMKNAPLNKINPHFKSKYADLTAVRDATLPTLSKHGLSIIQFTEAVAAGMLLHTRLLHNSGQWIESTYPIASDKPQVVGSALTYARRYSWASMTGIAAEEDDDANAAQANGNGVAKTIDEAQFRYLTDLIEKAGADEPRLLAYIKADNLESLTQAQYKLAEGALRKKITAAASTNGGSA